MDDTNRIDPDELLTVHDVARLLKVSAWTVYKFKRNPLLDFPRGVHLSAKTVRYRRGDILDWIAANQV